MSKFILLLSLITQTTCSQNSKEVTYSRTITYCHESDDLVRRFIVHFYATNMYDSTFDKKNELYYILNPEQPVEYAGQKYYWNETFMNLEGVRTLCQCRFPPHFDLSCRNQLDNTYFQNGEHLGSILYECSWYQVCDVLQCRLYIPVWAYGIIPLLLVYPVYRFLRNRHEKQQEILRKRFLTGPPRETSS